uniref:Putative secreted protein n=1 Tax=Ixodes ricinus TaxID=34613 RepID=V5HC26_IXORI
MKAKLICPRYVRFGTPRIVWLLLGAQCPKNTRAGSRYCGRITKFKVSTVVTNSRKIAVTRSSWSYKNVTANFEYIGNYTGHER